MQTDRNSEKPTQVNQKTTETHPKHEIQALSIGSGLNRIRNKAVANRVAEASRGPHMPVRCSDPGGAWQIGWFRSLW